MAVLNAQAITLASATLSNGAILASAGGGLPQRVTTSNPVWYDLTTTYAAGNCIAIAPDGSYVLVGGTNVLRRFDIDPVTGAFTFVWQAAVTGIKSVAWLNSTTVVCARSTSTAQYFEVNVTTGTPTTRTLTGTGATVVRRHLIPNAAGTMLWSCDATTTVAEFNATTFAATGRTITLDSAFTQGAISNGDGIEGFYVLDVTNTRFKKWRLDTLAVDRTWTFSPTTGATAPGKIAYTEMMVDPSGLPIGRSATAGGQIDRMPTLAAGGSVTVNATNADRLLWAGSEIRGATIPSTGGGTQLPPSMAMTPSADRFAFLTADLACTSPYGAIRVLRTTPARAVFSHTFAEDATVTKAVIPGRLGDLYGPSSGFRSGDPVQDFRHSRVYYKRVGVDGSPVEFTPQSDLSLAVSNGTVFEIYVDMITAWQMPGGPQPWVAGDAAEGPTLYYTTADPPVDNILPVCSVFSSELVTDAPGAMAFLSGTDSDADGTIVSRLWTQISGPNTATLAQETTSNLTISDMIPGTYTFRYTVTDNGGLTASADAQVFMVSASTIVFTPGPEGAFRARLLAGASLKARMDTP